MEEIWKDIPGYEGSYRVSSLGRVMTMVWHLTGKTPHPYPPKILKQALNRGYLRVLLIDPRTKARSSWSVHRLVLSSFIGCPDSHLQVNHINGIKTDNRLENLEWVTQSENMKHAYRLGLEKPCVNGLEKKIVAIKDGVETTFPSIREMCRTLNLCRHRVHDTIKGKCHHTKGYQFRIYE